MVVPSPLRRGGYTLIPPPLVGGGKGEGELKILEIGTGSGCIAIALAKELPKSTIVATDISAEALEVARGNAKRNGVVEKIEFVKADLFPERQEILRSAQDDQAFGLVISNPPYIKEKELNTLMPEVRDWEPRLALNGGPSGLDVIEKIISAAPDQLKPGGWLVLEIGHDQEKPLRLLLEDAGEFDTVDIHRDLAGHPRIALARLKM